MKKQLLFLLTLLLAFAPACSKQKNKPHLAGPNSAIAAGSILTAGGTATAITAGALSIALPHSIIGFNALWGSICIGSLAIATPILLATGIPLLVVGAIKRDKKIKKFKEEQKLQQIKAEISALEIQT